MGDIIVLLFLSGVILMILFLKIDIKLYDKYCHYFLTDNWCCNIGSGFLMWYKVRWGGNGSLNKGHQD